MVFEVVTTLDGAEVLRRAKTLLRRAGAAVRRVPGEGGTQLPRPPWAGWGGDRDRRAAGAGRDPGSRVDPALRPAAGSLPLDAARGRGECGMSGTLPLRVMVQDAWDEVQLDLPESTPLGEVKRQASKATEVTRDPRRVRAQVPGRRAVGRVQLARRRGSGAERRAHRASAASPPGSLATERGALPARLAHASRSCASAFLAFDGAALAGLGWWTGRTALAGGRRRALPLFGPGAPLVPHPPASPRRNRRRAKRAREETESLRRLLGG